MCVLAAAVLLLVLVRLGKVTDHHISNRKQRAPVLLTALGSVAAGLVLAAAGAPRSVMVMVLAIVAGIVVLASVSPFWKMSGHAAAVSSSTVISALMLGPAWLPLLLLIPAFGWSPVVLGCCCAAGWSSSERGSVAVDGVGRQHLHHLGISTHGAGQGSQCCEHHAAQDHRNA